MSDEEIYRRLIDWLKQAPGLLELVETDNLLQLVKAAYTPEEASFLIELPFQGKYLEELAEMKQIPSSELRVKLDEMAQKGQVFRTIRGDTISYRPNDLFFNTHRAAFWPERDDERNTAMAPWSNKYYYDLWDQFDYTHMKGLRALPVDGTIEDTRQIWPYEEVAKVLDDMDYFAVSQCACRHRKQLDPDSTSCNHLMETCFHFGTLGRYTVENGMGREITKEECKEMLRQCAEDGLVHGLSNVSDRPDTLCNCCKDCCLMFEAFHILKHAEGMAPSNYLARSDAESCIGCGTCVRRCPMEAIHLEDHPGARDRVTRITTEDGNVKELKNKTGKVAVINRDICIGCGVCAYKCQSDSLVLECREVIEAPPTSQERQKTMKADLSAAIPGQKRKG